MSDPDDALKSHRESVRKMWLHIGAHFSVIALCILAIAAEAALEHAFPLLLKGRCCCHGSAEYSTLGSSCQPERS